MTKHPPQLNDSDSACTILILNPTVPRPNFSLFQIVKVKPTQEVGTVVGIWYVETEEQSYQWLYRLEGLTEQSTTWWQQLHLRSLDRRQNRKL